MADEKPSLGVAVTAAMLPLATTPADLALLALAASASDTPMASGLAQAWNEGGFAMYACLFVALLGSLAASAAVFAAIRSSPLVLGLLPAVATSTVGVGATLGFRTGLAGALSAVVHAAPGDRGVIIAASLGELRWCVVFPLLLAGSLMALTGLACLGGMLARARERDPGPRRSLLSVGVVSLLLSGWLLASSRTHGFLGAAFNALALAEPAEKPGLLVEALQARAATQPFELGFLGLSLVTAVVLAVLVRASRQVSLGVVAYGLVTVAGVGGMRALTRVPADVEAGIAAVRFEALVELDSAIANTAPNLVLDEELRRLGKPFQGPLKTAPDEFLEAGLGAKATAAQLEALLRRAREEDLARVVLIGLHETPPPPGLDVPAVFRSAFTSYRSVVVELAREDDHCNPRCDWATLSESGLVVGGETWPLATRSEYASEGAPRLDVRWAAFEPRVLLGALNAAAAHQRQLVLVMPSLTKGALDKQAIHDVIRARRAGVRHCYELGLINEPALRGKVTASFVIDPSGKVTELALEGHEVSEELATCLRAQIERWVFPRPAAGVVKVRYPFIFHQAGVDDAPDE